MSGEIPKRIWFLWLQGVDDAPAIVRRCFESWRTLNPNWEIVSLDRGSLEFYARLPKRVLSSELVSAQALSDIIRINLLRDHGGVWVDATCLCTKPLDIWLPDVARHGFFAFDRPGPDRMVASWFLAAQRGNYVVDRWCMETNRIWDRKGVTSGQVTAYRLRKSRVENIMRALRYHPALSLFNKSYPYFWFHHLFAYLYISDKIFRKIWDHTPKFSADIPHYLGRYGLTASADQDIRNLIKNGISPAFKLKWKLEGAPTEDSVFQFVLNGC